MVVPVSATTYNFSFATPPSAVNGIWGTGVATTTAGDEIVVLTGTVCTGVTTCADMELLPVGAFASNDNVLTGAFPFVTVNGFSFEAINGVGSSPPAGDFNIYQGISAENYIDVCTAGTDCISQNSYGDPSWAIDFTVTEVATPEPVTFVLIGSGLLGLTFLRRRRPQR